MGYYLLICACWLYSVKSGQCTLTESIKQSSSECFGNSLSLTCDAGSVIAISDIKVGAHKSSSSCPVTWSAGTDSSCCSSTTDDCLFTLDTETNQQYHDDCNGRQLCSPQVLNVVLSTEKCGFADVSQYPVTTHYMSVDYYCIPATRIGSMCNVQLTAQASTVYVWSSGFPISRIPSSTGCSCSIEADDCGATIQTTTIQRMLTGNSVGTCDQLLSLKDESGTELSRWDCANNTVTLATTSTSSSYVTYTLENSRTADDGYLWVAFSVTSPSTAGLSVNCPAQPRTTTCNTTPTTTTVATTTTLATTSTMATTSTNNLITSTPTLTSPNKPTTIPSSNNIGIIVGAVIGSVVLIGIIVIVVVVYVKYRPCRHRRVHIDKPPLVDEDETGNDCAGNRATISDINETFSTTKSVHQTSENDADLEAQNEVVRATPYLHISKG